MKLFMSSIMHLIGGGTDRNAEYHYKTRMTAVTWVIGLTALLAFVAWSTYGSAVNTSRFKTDTLAPFTKAYATTDPAKMASLINEGIDNIPAIGYDKGYPNWFMPYTPGRDLAVLTANYRSIAQKATEVSNLDPSSEAYQVGMRSLLSHENWPTEGVPNVIARNSLGLYSAKFVREKGIFGALTRGFDYTAYGTIVFAILLFIALNYGYEYATGRAVDKYWGHIPRPSADYFEEE